MAAELEFVVVDPRTQRFLCATSAAKYLGFTSDQRSAAAFRSEEEARSVVQPGWLPYVQIVRRPI